MIKNQKNNNEKNNCKHNNYSVCSNELWSNQNNIQQDATVIVQLELNLRDFQHILSFTNLKQLTQELRWSRLTLDLQHLLNKYLKFDFEVENIFFTKAFQNKYELQLTRKLLDKALKMDTSNKCTIEFFTNQFKPNELTLIFVTKKLNKIFIQGLSKHQIIKVQNLLRKKNKASNFIDYSFII